MNIFQILVLLLFIGVSVTHLVFVFKENEKVRIITKGLIIGSLILFALSSSINEPLIYIGLCFSLFGDMLLLLKTRKIFFVIGASCFSITHIINFIILSRFIPKYLNNWMYYGIIILLGYLLVETVRPFVKNKLDKMAYPALIYLYIVLALIINSILAFIGTMNVCTGLIILGCFLFLASDNILTINQYVKKIKKANFIIMLLYILAQCFIYIPLIMSL